MRSNKHPRRRMAVVMLGLLSGPLTGCDSIQPVAPAAAPITDPAQLYTALTIDHPAVNLTANAAAPETARVVQLTAVPRDARDNSMPGLPAPTFKLVNPSDTTKVRVTADGLVTAVGAAALPGVSVRATLTVGPVTHVDTAHVVVTNLADPPKLASVSIHPIPPDSAVWTVSSINTAGAAGYLGLILAQVFRVRNWLPSTRAVDSLGNSMASGLAFAYQSLDLQIVSVDRWKLNKPLPYVAPRNPGQVRLVAQTYAYGIAKADTVTYTVTLPSSVSVQFDAASPIYRDRRVAPHALVSWELALPATTGDTFDITFDDPTHVMGAPDDLCTYFTYFGGTSPCGTDVGGNGFIVANSGPEGSPFNDSYMIRSFPDTGVYPYHSVRHPELSGKIIVTADPFAH